MVTPLLLNVRWSCLAVALLMAGCASSSAMDDARAAVENTNAARSEDGSLVSSTIALSMVGNMTLVDIVDGTQVSQRFPIEWDLEVMTSYFLDGVVEFDFRVKRYVVNGTDHAGGTNLNGRLVCSPHGLWATVGGMSHHVENARGTCGPLGPDERLPSWPEGLDAVGREMNRAAAESLRLPHQNVTRLEDGAVVLATRFTIDTTGIPVRFDLVERAHIEEGHVLSSVGSGTATMSGSFRDMPTWADFQATSVTSYVWGQRLSIPTPA